MASDTFDVMYEGVFEGHDYCDFINILSNCLLKNTFYLNVYG